MSRMPGIIFFSCCIRWAAMAFAAPDIQEVSVIAAKRKPATKPHIRIEQHGSICTNKNCKLRKAGCKGFEACPGYKGR